MKVTVLVVVVFVLEVVYGNQCGYPAIQPDTSRSRTNNLRIVGGTDAIKGSWPWQVRIGYRKADWFGTNIELICGGSIINQRYIVTAAHCVDRDLNPAKYVVTVGDYDRTYIEENEVNHEIKQIIMYPGYAADTTNNDLALLEVAEEIEFNQEVWPICLPSQGHDPSVNTKCFATGWGDTDAAEWRSSRSKILTKGQSTVLQQVAVRTMSRSVCKSNYYPGLISDQMICAGYDEGGRDPCKADSGGPLACLNKYNGYDLVGVISWGHGCGWPKQPGVYTRVGSFANWISDNSRL